MRSRRWELVLSVSLVAVVTLISFLSSLDNDFVNWDDDLYVTQNSLIRDLSWNNITEIFFSPVITSYVPLVPLSFSLEYARWGLNPFGYHLTNLLLHLINSLLVFALVLRLTSHVLPALVAALLFGVHPLHVESVAWVSERKDVLSTLFFLGSLLCYLRYQEDRRTVLYALSFVAFVLSLLAKPMVVTLPLIMFLCDYLSQRAWTTRSVLEKVPFLGMSALFSVVAVLTSQSAGDPHVPHLPSPGDNVLIACWALVFYLGKILVPVQLSAFYPYPAEISLWLPTFFLPPIVLLALASGIWISRQYTRKVIFGSLFFFLTLLPVLNIVPFSGAAAADRYMYIPSIGLFYLAGVALQNLYAWKIRWEKAKKASLTLLLVFTVLIFGMLTWQRSNVWQDSETLWLSVLKNYPGVPHAHINLGNIYLKRGRLDAAITEYKEAISQNPTDILAHYNLGNVYLKKGMLDAAVSEYKKVIYLDPSAALAHKNLGNVFLRKGQLDAAIAEYKKAILLNPKDALAHNNLGNAYLRKGELDAAISEYKKATSLNPIDARVHYNLGVVYEGKGELDAAISEYQKAILLNPTAGAHYNLGNVYLRKGELDAAIAEYLKTISLNPTNAPAHTNLGIIYARKGELDMAIAEYKRAISLNPADAVAHYNLGIIHEGTGKLDEAIVEYKKAVSLDPQRKLFYYKLASALYVDDQPKSAISVLEKVFTLFPGDRTATVMLQEYREVASPAGTK